MAKGRKPVTQDDFGTFVKEVATALTIMGGDLMRMQQIFYNYLNEMGKMETPTCVHCKEQLLIPIVNGIEKSEISPQCNNNIYGKGTTTFENWDAGNNEEE